MFLNRASAVAALTFAIGGGTLTFSNMNPWLSQSIAQDANPAVERRDRPMPRWIGDLNLTPEQMQRMLTVQNQYKDRLRQNQAALREADRELQSMLSSNASQNQIREKHRQVEALRQQLGQLRFESMLAMREILTPEQRRLMAERMRRRERGDRG